jgi:hypothetical protein
VCTCGWSLVVSRTRLHDSTINQVVAGDNAGISIATMTAIIHHAPSFTVGHNIYAFDNPVLALNLPKGHKYSQMFREVTKSVTMTAPTAGLMMCIPGINNLDTYMFIRASMFGQFCQFSLDTLCKQLNLPVQKMTTSNIHVDLDWYTESAGSAISQYTVAF